MAQIDNFLVEIVNIDDSTILTGKIKTYFGSHLWVCNGHEKQCFLIKVMRPKMSTSMFWDTIKVDSHLVVSLYKLKVA